MIPALTGVLLAAGRARRMGRTKQLLPWPSAGADSTVVAAAFDALASLADSMVVVLGHDGPAVATALGDRRFVAVAGRPDEEMLDSVRRGIAAASPGSAIALHPADHPRIGPAARTALDDARRRHPDDVIIPTHEDRGGHPVIIPPGMRDEILDFAGPGGLRAVWRAHPARCLRVPIDDPWITTDLDTPAQYDAAREDGA